MTSPQAEPSAQALGESLAALAVQVAALRGQIATDQPAPRPGRAPRRPGSRRPLRRARPDGRRRPGRRRAPRPRRALLDRPGPARLRRRSWSSCGSGPIPCCASTTAAMSCGTAGLATSTPSGNCLPWPPPGTTPTAASGPTWPAPWSSTTAGSPAPCAASPTSPGPAYRSASCSAVPGDRSASGRGCRDSRSSAVVQRSR